MPGQEEITTLVSENLRDGNLEEIRKTLSGIHPSEIANIIQNFDPEDHTRILNILDNETASDVLFELDKEQRDEILEELDNEKIADILDEMDSDDAADIIGELPEDTAKTVLEKMDPEEAKEVEPLLIYPEDSAGGIMQTELVKVQSDFTVRETINWIRLIAGDVEDFNGIYVTDEENKLLGFISLSTLILANPRSRAKNIMEPVEVKVTPYIDQEKVAKEFQKYDVVSLPVVDSSEKLIGRITADDILDVITEEASEDMYQFAGVSGDQLHPLFSPTVIRIKERIPWLLLTLFGELLIALIIVSSFQTTLQKFVILVAFMPAIMATGGNVGIQTTTIVIRSIAMGTISIKQISKVIISEIKVGLVLGIVCGLTAAIIGALISYNQPEVIKLSLSVFIAMVSATLATSFIGVAAPLMLFKFNFDPAASSGPFLTMFNDIFGSVFYLFIAMLIF